MKKINFNLEQWKSGGYDVVTRGGSIVEMGTYSDKGILAWVGGVGYGWPVDGKYMEGEPTGH